VLLALHAHRLDQQSERGQDNKKLCSGDLLGMYDAPT